MSNWVVSYASETRYGFKANGARYVRQAWVVKAEHKNGMVMEYEGPVRVEGRLDAVKLVDRINQFKASHPWRPTRKFWLEVEMAVA